MLTIGRKIALLTVLVLYCCTAARSASRGEVVDRLEQFRQFFVDFQYAPDSGVPGSLLAACHGVIIMRQYKAGFVFGVQGGDGVILLHDRATGAWSAPGFVITAEGSFGFQIGGQAVDAIILIMNQNGVDMLLRSRFQIGVDASVAAGPVGRDFGAEVGPGTALLAYSRTRGLFAGASLEGGALLNYNAFNQAFYGRPVGLREILIDGAVPILPEAMPIIRTLESFAVYTQASPLGPSIAPPGPAPMPEGYNGAYAPGGQQYQGQQYQGQQYQGQQYQGQYRDPQQAEAARRQAALDAEARRAAEAAADAARAAREAAAEADAAAARAQRGGW